MRRSSLPATARSVELPAVPPATIDDNSGSTAADARDAHDASPSTGTASVALCVSFSPEHLDVTVNPTAAPADNRQPAVEAKKNPSNR